MSVVLALGALLLCMSACQHIPKTQLVMFESISFNMPIESFEKAFGEADEVIEETETAYRDTWHAKDPYFYKTGRLFYHYENIALNGYYTQWMDKSLRRKIGQEYANLTGLDAVHMGVELEATYRPVKSFELKGMFSLGDWKWKDDIHFTMYDEANNPIGTYDAYLKDVHVGNSAQLTSALSASWEPFKGFKISADYNFFGKNYADFDPQNRVNEADAGIDSWKLPDYGTIDLGMNYRFNITKDIRAIVYSNVYNLTNTEYIADAKDGTNHDWKTALVYYGFGTTWSAGFKVIF